MDAKQFFLSIVFVLTGLFVMYLGVKAIRRAQNTKAWTQTMGTITHSQLQQSRSVSYRNGRMSSNTMYNASVQYSYSVKGKKYEGHSIRASNEWTSSFTNRARKTVLQFPEGASVPVWYDPTMPGDSVLIQGTSFGDFAIVAFGLLFAAIGVLVGIQAFQESS